MQSTKVEVKVNEVVPDNINGYALVLKNKVVKVSSSGHWYFELNESKGIHKARIPLES